MKFVTVIGQCLVIVLLWLAREIDLVKQTDQRDVVFIVVDDLRPALGAYGDRKSVTPNIDAFAANGFVFENAFAQVSDL